MIDEPDNPPLLPRRIILGGIQKIWYNKNMKHNRILISMSIIGLAAIILMLNFTSPTEIGPIGVLVFFTTLYISFFGIVALALQVFFRLAYGRTSLKNKDYIYAAILAFSPIMVLMARSFSAITPWTIGLIIVFLFLAEFLVYKKI